MENGQEDSRSGKRTLADLQRHTAGMPLEEMRKAQTLSVSPSQLEGDGISGYTPKDAGYVREERPSGKGLGLVMHKAFELLVQRYDRIAGTDKAVFAERILNESVLSVRDEMLASDDPQAIIAWLKPVLVRYMDTVISSVLADAEEVYPEYTFSFYVEGEELAAFVSVFREYFRSYDIEMNDNLQRIWINGTSDLVVRKKDGTVCVYDYKSDARSGMPLAAFEESAARKYEGQLRLYRYAVGRTFGTDSVQTELIHMYR